MSDLVQTCEVCGKTGEVRFDSRRARRCTFCWAVVTSEPVEMYTQTPVDLYIQNNAVVVGEPVELHAPSPVTPPVVKVVAAESRSHRVEKPKRKAAK